MATGIRAQEMGPQNRVKLVFRRLTLSGDPVLSSKGAYGPTRFLQGVTIQNIVQKISVGDNSQPTTMNVIDVRNAIVGRTPAFKLEDNTLYPVLSKASFEGGLPYVVDQGTEYFIYDPSLDVNLGSVDTVNVFTFYVNPQRISFTDRKSKTPMRTLGGFEVQHWGNELTELNVTGISGGMHRINQLGVNRGLLPTETIRDSTAWQRIQQLKNIYDSDQAVRNKQQGTLWSLEYNAKVYIGTFSSFTGPEEENAQPWYFRYSFVFQVEQERTSAIIANKL